MSQADLFASTEFDCIDSRSVDWLTSDHVQVTTTQMEWKRQGTEKAAFPYYNEYHINSILTWARKEVKDVEEIVLCFSNIAHRDLSAMLS